jgi:hypothetical protein
MVMNRNLTRLLATAAAGISLGMTGFAATADAAQSGPAAAATFSGRLYSVAAVSPTDAWAVGLHPNSSLIVHWNGHSWTQSLAGAGYYNGVAADSADDAWAVGGTNWFSPARTLAEHWNGTSWTRVPSPTPAGGGIFAAVTATSPTNAWAVGRTGGGPGVTGVFKPLIEHWNGTTWTQQRFPLPTNGGLFTAVTATSATNAWAVGWTGSTSPGAGTQTLIEHWNGRTWTRVASPNPAGTFSILDGVAASGPGNVWAVGYTGTNGGPDQPLILHWQDGAWVAVPSPSPTGDVALQSVATTSHSDVWAVGLTHPTTCSPQCGTLIEHWNGKTWRQVPSPNPPAGYLNAFAGVAALNCHNAWAVGTTDYASTLIAHWNGKSWN